MHVLSDLQKVRDGVVLESSVMNRHLACRVLKNQTVSPFVRVFDLVVFSAVSNKWVTSGNMVPAGMYVGDGVVLFSGLVTGMSGLRAGVFYYMDSAGKLVDNISASFNNVKVGYSIGVDKLLLDIDVVGFSE